MTKITKITKITNKKWTNVFAALSTNFIPSAKLLKSVVKSETYISGVTSWGRIVFESINSFCDDFWLSTRYFLEIGKFFYSGSTKLLITCLGETLAERGLLQIVTFRKYFRSLVKTSRTSSEKNAADLSNLHSLCTEETFEEKKR